MSEAQEQTPPGAGRSLDALVAQRLTDKNNTIWHDGEDWIIVKKGMAIEQIPQYSTDIGAAWELVRFLDENREDRSFSIELTHIEWGPENWQCEMRYDYVRIDHVALGVGVSEAHAICLALLALPDFEVKQ